jgi:hypothetical protein
MTTDASAKALTQALTSRPELESLILMNVPGGMSRCASLTPRRSEAAAAPQHRPSASTTHPRGLAAAEAPGAALAEASSIKRCGSNRGSRCGLWYMGAEAAEKKAAVVALSLSDLRATVGSVAFPAWLGQGSHGAVMKGELPRTVGGDAACGDQ